MHCPHCQTQIAGAVAALGKIGNTDATAQEDWMLQRLRELGPVGATTDDFRAAGVYQVSARLHALRHKRLCVIHTELYSGLGADGVYHCRMARYRLISEGPAPAKGARKRCKSGAGAAQAGEGACQ